MTLAMHDMVIREEAREEGREEGKDEERLFNIRNAMKKLNLSVEKPWILWISPQKISLSML